jgi:hypothetical protein
MMVSIIVTSMLQTDLDMYNAKKKPERAKSVIHFSIGFVELVFYNWNIIVLL